MNVSVDSFTYVIEQSGWLAPLLFIMLHIFRQLFFIPVLLVCLLGGYLFGIVYGTIYSIFGLTAISFVFYFLAGFFPGLLSKLTRLKEKWFKNYHKLSFMQILVLRLVPFVHFHLVSLYLMEMSSNFKEYAKYSFYASIPPAFIFTAFGHLIHELPLISSVVLIILLLILFHFIGRKETTIKWQEFFTAKS